MRINHKVALGLWDEISSESTKPSQANLCAVEVDGVVVLFENGITGLEVTTIGGDARTNKRVLRLWDKCLESIVAASTEELRDTPMPKWRDDFVKWLIRRSAKR